MKNKIKKAFSLLEMIIVIVIMGILFSVISKTNLNFGFADNTYFYLKQMYGDTLNINNFKYNGEFPDFADAVLEPSKSIQFYTYYKDDDEDSGYKKILWNKDTTITDTVWLDGEKINKGQAIIFRTDFTTDDLSKRYKVYKKEYDGTLTDISNDFDYVCLENFSRRRYCIDKNFNIIQIKDKTVQK